MMNDKRVLLVLSDDEMRDFLASPVKEELLELCPNHRRLDTIGASAERYIEELMSYRPEIVVTAWSTPGLPESKISEILEFLRYQVHLTGTIRLADGGMIPDYRTRASWVLEKAGGDWVLSGAHYSPLFGGSGVRFD